MSEGASPESPGSSGSSGLPPEPVARGGDLSGSAWAGRTSLLAALLVILLALGAVIWPRSQGQGGSALLLVYDSSGNIERQESIYRPLADFLGEITGRELDLALVGQVADFRRQASEGAEFLLCPDGLSLGLDPDDFAPLVIARRSVPHNLRPRSVLVYRKSRGKVIAPWRKYPQRTVFGDSVSLVATAGLRHAYSVVGPEVTFPSDRAVLRTCAWGPDPFDHSPVLHAARLGAYDYAVVRQWDADRFFQEGLLSSLTWGREVLSTPVPDIVLLCRDQWSPSVRLKIRQALASLGRSDQSLGANATQLMAGLERLHLAGFNLLLEPELKIVRVNFAKDWPPAGK